MRQASILARLGALKTKFDEDGPVKQLVLEHVTMDASDQSALESMSREDVRVFIVPFQLAIPDVEKLIDTMQADLERRRQDQWAAKQAVDNARAKVEGEKQLGLADMPAPAEDAPTPPQPEAPPGAWYCPECECEVPPEEVTHEGDHDPEQGGCGNKVEWVTTERAAALTGEGDPDLVPGDPRYYCLECKKRVHVAEVTAGSAEGSALLRYIHSRKGGGCGGPVYKVNPGEAAPDFAAEGKGNDARADAGERTET